MRRIAIFIFLVVAGFSCSKTTVTITAEERLAQDIAVIDKYLAENGISPTISDPSGLRIVITETGTGPLPTKDNCFVVDYSGSILYETTPFESNTNYKAPLKVMILGWQIGLKKLPVGSKATLYIPSGLAYGGRTDIASIPANSILRFDITLHSLSVYNSLAEYCN